MPILMNHTKPNFEPAARIYGINYRVGILRKPTINRSIIMKLNFTSMNMMTHQVRKPHIEPSMQKSTALLTSFHTHSYTPYTALLDPNLIPICSLHAIILLCWWYSLQHIALHHPYPNDR